MAAGAGEEVGAGPAIEPRAIWYRSSPHVRTGPLIFSLTLHATVLVAAAAVRAHASGQADSVVEPRVQIQLSLGRPAAAPVAVPEPEVVLGAVPDFENAEWLPPLAASEPLAFELVVVEAVVDFVPPPRAMTATLQRVKPLPAPIVPTEPETETRIDPNEPSAAAAAEAAPWVEGSPRADNEAPRYPEPERRAGHEGAVVVTVTIDASGAVLGVELRTPSPFPALNREALRAVRAWRFEPARRLGVAIVSTTDVTIEFRLSSSGGT